MALEPASAAFVAQMAAARKRPLIEMAPEEVRAGTARMRPLFGNGPAMLRADDLPLGPQPGAVRGRLLVPEGELQALVVYLHGGGWTTGHVDDFDAFARTLAGRSRCAVLLVDYRLAPEHPFPAAVHDACQALAWATGDSSLRELGQRLPVVIAGDSAGANLATVATRRARDAGAALPRAQVLVYPATDCDFASGSYLDPECQLLLNRDTMRWYWGHYLPEDDGRAHPDASPLRAPDLAGLPPTLLLTAEYDPLRDEGEAYARRLAGAGVQVDFERCTGQMHGFLTMVNVLPGSAWAIARIADFIARHTER